MFSQEGSALQQVPVLFPAKAAAEKRTRLLPGNAEIILEAIRLETYSESYSFGSIFRKHNSENNTENYQT